MRSGRFNHLYGIICVCARAIAKLASTIFNEIYFPRQYFLLKTIHLYLIAREEIIDEARRSAEAANTIVLDGQMLERRWGQPRIILHRHVNSLLMCLSPSHFALAPPSTGNTIPVTYPLSLPLASHTAAPDTSRGLPRWRAGIIVSR